jgi:hypothetical protein
LKVVVAHDTTSRKKCSDPANRAHCNAAGVEKAIAENLFLSARVGYVRTRTGTQAKTAFNWSDIGVTEGQMSGNNQLPSLQILGSVSIASGFPRNIAQNSFVLSDDLSLVRRGHRLRFGASITRLQDNVDLIGLGSLVRFLSWPDFLLGLSATDNETGFSNVFESFDDFGLSTREYRVTESDEQEDQD